MVAEILASKFSEILHFSAKYQCKCTMGVWHIMDIRYVFVELGLYFQNYLTVLVTSNLKQVMLTPHTCISVPGILCTQYQSVNCKQLVFLVK